MFSKVKKATTTTPYGATAMALFIVLYASSFLLPADVPCRE